MTSLVWDSQGMLHVDYLEVNETVTRLNAELIEFAEQQSFFLFRLTTYRTASRTNMLQIVDGRNTQAHSTLAIVRCNCVRIKKRCNSNRVHDDASCSKTGIVVFSPSCLLSVMSCHLAVFSIGACVAVNRRQSIAPI